MQLVRPFRAQHPTRFGKGKARSARMASKRASQLKADVRLFASTFVLGFLFVSIVIG